ncbi:MAG TPA: DUF368 domain-containing protein [Methanocorpusculum sp.]|nr:DUF368 domain-containing protein [Methanocorpusculum sp.]
MNILGTIKDFLRGICMAAADSVPGVSGGTIAFLLGFYEKFIVSVNDFLLGRKEKKLASLPFLVKLGLGWVVGFAVCAVILSAVFDANIYALSSLFLGLTLLAIPIVIYEERNALRGKLRWCFFTLIGICVVPLLVQLGGAVDVGDISHITFPLAVILFIAAVLAVSVMVLPGISGSTLLLIFGLYVPLISAVSAVLHLDFSCVPALLIFFAGALVGFALCTKVIRFCFERFRAQTIFMIIGLLIGSFYAIVKGPETLSVPQEMMTISTFNIGFFLIGAAVMVLLQVLKWKFGKNCEKKE